MKLPVNYDKLQVDEKRVVRQEYVKLQGGLCYHCKSSLTEEPPSSILNKRVNEKLFPPNFFKYPVHLHHSHVTGMTIGAVHCYCNAVLWQYYGE